MASVGNASALQRSHERWLKLHEGEMEYPDSGSESDESSEKVGPFSFPEALEIKDGSKEEKNDFLSLELSDLRTASKHSVEHIAGPPVAFPNADALVLVSVVGGRNLNLNEENDAFFVVLKYGDIYARTCGVSGTQSPCFANYSNHNFMWRYRAQEDNINVSNPGDLPHWTRSEVTVMLFRKSSGKQEKYVGKTVLSLRKEGNVFLNSPVIKWCEIRDKTDAHGELLLRYIVVDPSTFDKVALKHATAFVKVKAAARGTSFPDERPYLLFSTFAARNLPPVESKLHRSWVELELMRGTRQKNSDGRRYLLGEVEMSEEEKKMEALRDRAVTGKVVYERENLKEGEKKANDGVAYWGAPSSRAAAAASVKNDSGEIKIDLKKNRHSAAAASIMAKKDFHFRLPKYGTSSVGVATDDNNGITIQMYEYARDLMEDDGKTPAGRRRMVEAWLPPPEYETREEMPNVLKTQWISMKSSSKAKPDSDAELLVVWGQVKPNNLVLSLFPEKQIRFLGSDAAQKEERASSKEGAGTSASLDLDDDDNDQARLETHICTADQLQQWGTKFKEKFTDPLRALVKKVESVEGDFKLADGETISRGDLLSSEMESSLELLVKLLRLQTSLKEEYDDSRRLKLKQLEEVTPSKTSISDWQELNVIMNAKVNRFRKQIVEKILFLESLYPETSRNRSFQDFEGMKANELAAEFAKVNQAVQKHAQEKTAELRSRYDTAGEEFLAQMEELKTVVEASEIEMGLVKVGDASNAVQEDTVNNDMK
eukprot:g4487.t1